MKTLLIVAVVLVGVVVVFTQVRFAKTVYLIARVSPYEQSGTGAGMIQVLGDSTGYGTGATSGKKSIAGLLGADFPDFTIKNQSVNGRTIAGLLKDSQDFSGEYDMILLQIGGNDILQNRDTAQVLAELSDLLDILSEHTNNIVMMTSGNVGASIAFSGEQAQEYERLTRDLRAGVFDIARDRGDFTYVDLFDEPEDDPFLEQPEVYTSLDGLHPSNAGYALWYSQLKPVVTDILTSN